MRYSLSALLIILFSLSATSQRGRAPLLDGVWLETSIGRNGKLLPIERQPKRTVLALATDGYFEETRPGRSRYSPERRFAGRWDADYRRGDLVLNVNQAGRPATTPRGYRRGRTQRVRYNIVYSNTYQLVIRNQRTGEKRVFLRE